MRKAFGVEHIGAEAAAEFTLLVVWIVSVFAMVMNMLAAQQRRHRLC